MLQDLLIAAAVMTGAQAAFGRPFTGTAAYPQTFDDQFNPLKYTGNLGPYTERPGVGISPDVPEGCVVEQVVLFARHGERFPADFEVVAQEALLAKILKSAPPTGFVGSLDFLDTWTYFLPTQGYANLEIPSGPYSGLAGSYRFGAEFAGKYGDLWNDEVLPIFTDNYERDLESARAFGQGFLGFNYSKSAAINTYPSLGTCNATKWTTCPVKSNATVGGGYPANTFRYPAFEKAALRLNEENDLKLTVDDVFLLFTIASYDIAVRGSSPWVDVFTSDEWLAYQYSYDVYFDCYYGSQSPRATALGSLFVNATAELLKAGPSDLPLALVFGHDADLMSILAALDLAMPSRKLDPNVISFNNNFRLTDVVPMGARFVMERLSCKAPGLTNDTDLTGAVTQAPELWNPNWTTPGTNFTQWYPNITVINGTNATGANSSMWNSNGTSPLYPNATWSNATWPNATWSNATWSNSTWSNSTWSNATWSNSTWSNSTWSNTTWTNSTSNSTGGTTWAESPETATTTTFVRFILNGAVVPWGPCYDGPGFSCSLDNYLTLVEKQLGEIKFETVCGTKPTPLTFFSDYNTSTSLNYDTEDIPYQAAKY